MKIVVSGSAVWSLRCFGLLFILVGLTACLGGGNEEAVAPEAAAPGNVLQCSETCRSEGQCGETADGRTLILAHSGQPATQNHNITLPANTSANIILTEERTLVRPADGQTFNQPFHQIQTTDTGQIAWVAAWCVGTAN